MTLGWYVTGFVLKRILAVALALGALALALDLVDSATEVLARDEDGALLRYLRLRLPLILAVIAPVALIVGPVLAFMTLAGRNELTVVRAAGVTTYRLIGSLVPLAIALGAGLFWLNDSVVPRMEQRLVAWLTEAPDGGIGGFWTRTPMAVVRVGASSADGTLLTPLDVYETDRQGRLTGRLRAEAARFEDGSWRLSGATRRDPMTGETRELEPARWRTPLRPDNILALATPTSQAEGAEARRVLAGEWAGNRTDAYYRVRVYRGYAAAATPLVMILLAAPASFGLRRFAGYGLKAAIGVALGFGFIMVDGMLTALGETSILSPALAAFGGTAMFACIGLWALIVMED